jgi:hypothetical protein
VRLLSVQGQDAVLKRGENPQKLDPKQDLGFSFLLDLLELIPMASLAQAGSEGPEPTGWVGQDPGESADDSCLVGWDFTGLWERLSWSSG